jgi:hypothetical protein
LEHDEVLEKIDIIRALHDQFDQQLELVFGSRVEQFQPRLKELLFEFWMSARKQGADEARADQPPEKDWVEELGDTSIGEDRVLNAFENRLVQVMSLRGTPLELLQQAPTVSHSEFIQVLMDKSTGKTFGVEDLGNLLQNNPVQYYQSQQFVTECNADESLMGSSWKLAELAFAPLPKDDLEITGVWVDNVLSNPGSWMTYTGQDSKGDFVITEIRFHMPQPLDAQILVHWTSVSSEWGHP